MINGAMDFLLSFIAFIIYLRHLLIDSAPNISNIHLGYAYTDFYTPEVIILLLFRNFGFKNGVEYQNYFSFARC